MSQAELYKLTPEGLERLGAEFTDVTHINLSGDYSYMISGYYDSLDAELEGRVVLPTTADALDAYVVPIAMEKARLHGIPVPDYDIVTDKFTPPPLLAYPINPFSTKSELITSTDDLEGKFRALSMTGKYAVLCQHVPRDYRIDVVRCIMGQSLIREYDAFTARLFEIFRLPLMRVRVIVTTSEYLLSGIEPLPYDNLTLNEKKLLTGLSTWQD